MYTLDLAAVSVAVTVLEGQTVTLRCSIISAHKHYVEWKNPKGYTMFFSKNRGERCEKKRYNIVKLSETEFIVSISNVTFRDGGNYTCHEYADVPKEKTVEVTVLGLPKIETGKHDGKFLVKCTTAANSHPPQISWVLDQETEIIGHPQVYVEDKKYISQDMLHVKSVRNRITVKCLFTIQRYNSRPLINFVKIGRTLLVFLVTCLILALLVVVIFFAIKLRRAHLIWKRENEDSDPSEESHKSKSSQEEKQSQGQRRRGILNTTFTQYIVEEPAVMTSAINTNAVIASESTNHEERSPVISAQGPVRCEIKETEL
ncbi:LOW QUALITY PROTEIN: cytotoxic and regulatory T-cell molecule-like [Thalassophryne amazonica]|uniref:LOW QUALITY PROTEIN: cytotoxic and regulatory T-cell molecule-like n=1 Tax=Thalassophryne amazonica TaxID=390379 RepID=UPI0014716A37|nr:LOW QUALITY PROTEIN: cytotoxic and regulatory T-cell molecule-like [Thalassophryne amazonica]